ncbi:hypothetical protein [Rhodococcus tibetensis]|uniref:Uncharacterized protein n=1 Tax=Rhodococcus tibetensis TaxID=2965064 RepID=A0ABT1QDA3_9NOCA|nr:hypothetical protein [Rhodococcus sp. FXJ9.536]MCQ4120254.1 hypothetical protein [Rhodococcus sp. FXJ9.536]
MSTRNRPAGSTPTLTSAAFGADPGRHPLPPATRPVERWMRAVALGGQGRYSRARAELADITRDRQAGPEVVSLAWSTQASLLRQLGNHRAASGLDGRALALVGAGPADRAAESVLVRAARCDALTGLAADALGCGRLALGWRLLDRCGEQLAGELSGRGVTGAEGLWRQQVRRHWVSAELFLAGADFPSARRHAVAAAEISAVAGSVRHHLKSELLRSASMTGEPDTEPAAQLAAEVLDGCERHGLIPLKWAAAMLLAGLTGDRRAQQVREECEAMVAARGGHFRT